MKLKVEITTTASIEIKVNKKILDEVSRIYDGDFSEWANDNYEDYLSSHDFNLEDFKCSYDKEKATSLLKKAKEYAGVSSDCEWQRDKIDSEKLSASHIKKPEIKLKKVKVDVDLMAKARLFTDTHNPKIELNYIYLSDKKTIATDTRVLIQSEHKYSFNGVFMPTYFVKPLQDDAVLYMSDDDRLYLLHNNKWYESITNESKEEMKYPDVFNIYPDSNHNCIDYKTVKKQDVFIDSVDRKDVSHIFKDGERVFLQKKYDELLDLFDVVSVQKYGDSKKPKPYFVHAKNGIEITIMPLAVESYIDAIEKENS